MTRKRRVTKTSQAAAAAAAAAISTPIAPLAANSPARSGLSTFFSSAVAPPTPSRSAAASSLPVLSPPLKKRVHARNDARGVKAPSLEDALDAYDVGASDSSALRHNVKPDPHLPDPFKHGATVLEHKGSIYDAMLTRARVHQHQCEFIALQALEHKREFFLWQRAGTLGSPGKPLLVGPFECAERVVMEFCSVFSAKTNCAWAERHSLQYQDGSFTWIELDYSMGTPYADVATTASLDGTGDPDEPPPARGQKRRRFGSSRSATTAASTAPATTPLTRQYNFVDDWPTPASGSKRSTVLPPSRLHTDVQTFVQMIADPNEHQSYSYSETEDVMEEAQKMPLGRLSKTTIKRGYETLEQIYDALQRRATSRTLILNLSSHFYSIIPHHARLDAIDTMIKLGKKVAMMESVRQNVRGMSTMDVVRRCTERNYLDECYDLIGCALEPLAETSSEYAHVQTYVKNANCCGWKDGTLQLQHVFRVDKPTDAARFAPYKAFPNRRILWHGSRMGNWLGILTDGLRIAPPDVASNGRIFGKGIYFTDKASKAQAYCHASARHGGQATCVFVLSEVALGDVKEMATSDENAKRWVHTSSGGHAKTAHAYNSCKGVGTCRPDASGDVEDVDGAIWPLGTPTPDSETTGLNHSEYIIYNPAQARMRYVVVATSTY